MEDGAAPDAPKSPAPGPGRLILVGTGHVLRIEDAVRDAILALRPDHVFVELDRGRLHSLLERRAGRAPPVRGSWFQRRLQAFQEGVAKAYGTEAGAEMIAAVEGGRMVGADVRLVDRDIRLTLRRVMKGLTIRERLRAVGMMAWGGLRSLAPGRKGPKNTRAAVEEELRQYQEDPVKALDELGAKFPTVRRVIIDERDAYMSARILRALQPGQSGVAVVGDGHVPGMMRHLEGLDLEVHRLNDVREGRLPKPDPDSTRSVSFSFDLDQ